MHELSRKSARCELVMREKQVREQLVSEHIEHQAWAITVMSKALGHSVCRRKNVEIVARYDFPLLRSEDVLSLFIPVGCASAPSEGVRVQHRFEWDEELDGVRG